MQEPWQDLAACKGKTTEIFFPVTKTKNLSYRNKIKPAQEICSECPVRLHCYREAKHNEEQFGVWGGRNFYEDHNDNRNTSP